MIEIRHFKTTDVQDAIPKAILIAKKDKCIIYLDVVVAGYNKFETITLTISDEDTYEKKLLQFKEVVSMVRSNRFVQYDERNRIWTGSVTDAKASKAQRLRESSVSDKFRIYTKLQDGGWEFCKNDEYDTLGEADDEVVKMIRGALGQSCMYEIRQGSRVLRTNGHCFGLAHLKRGRK